MNKSKYDTIMIHEPKITKKCQNGHNTILPNLQLNSTENNSKFN